jgi:hypothetical protein
VGCQPCRPRTGSRLRRGLTTDSDQRSLLLRGGAELTRRAASHCAIGPLCSMVKKGPFGTLQGSALTMGRLGASPEAVDRSKSLSADGATKTLQQAICPPNSPGDWPAKRCARPDRGCPGGSIRSMQGGWGAQHRSDMVSSFTEVELAIIGLDRHWCCEPRQRFKDFLKMLTWCRASRIFLVTRGG